MTNDPDDHLPPDASDFLRHRAPESRFVNDGTDQVRQVMERQLQRAIEAQECLRRMPHIRVQGEAEWEQLVPPHVAINPGPSDDVPNRVAHMDADTPVPDDKTIHNRLSQVMELLAGLQDRLSRIEARLHEQN